MEMEMERGKDLELFPNGHLVSGLAHVDDSPGNTGLTNESVLIGYDMWGVFVFPGSLRKRVYQPGLDLFRPH